MSGEMLCRKRRLSSFQIIILGFAGVILLGALLLMLPISAAARCVTPFHEALFTATSAVCVTGLVVQDTGSYWSVFGQAVILTVELDSSAPHGVGGGTLSAGTPWPEKNTQESLTVALIKEDDDGNLTVEQQVYGTPLMLLTGTCK